MLSLIRCRTSGATRNVSFFALALFSISASACRDASAPTGPNAKRMELAPSTLKRSAIQKHDHRIQDEYIVVFDNTVEDVRGRAAALAAVSGGSMRFTFSTSLKGFAAHMSAQAAAAIAEHPGVAYVEQDQEVRTSEVQTYTPTWGIDRVDQTLLPLDGQYSYGSTGSGVSVYIIDTGIRKTHVQFGGRAIGGYTAIADAYGTDDCNGHGTHVSGTIGGGQVGVAKSATLYAVRVLDCNGSGLVSGVIAGIDWVTANRRVPAVANLSLSGDYSDALNTAIQNSINSGVTYVVAAGNAATDACGYSPSSAGAAVTVAASTVGDQQASYSNFGPCVDIYAPGTAIVSAWNTSDDILVKASGTSMASPHVAGAAALYLQANPGATPAQVSQAILASATVNALTLVASNTPNRLLRVNGPADGAVLPPPSSPSPTPNAAPSATFAVNCPSQKNYCSFDASNSTDDKGIVSYTWNFGDNGSALVASSPMTSHTYPSKGSYTVTLTVTDASGLSATTQKSILIKSIGRR